MLSGQARKHSQTTAQRRTGCGWQAQRQGQSQAESKRVGERCSPHAVQPVPRAARGSTAGRAGGSARQRRCLDKLGHFRQVTWELHFSSFFPSRTWKCGASNQQVAAAGRPWAHLPPTQNSLQSVEGGCRAQTGGNKRRRVYGCKGWGKLCAGADGGHTPACTPGCSGPSPPAEGGAVAAWCGLPAAGQGASPDAAPAQVSFRFVYITNLAAVRLGSKPMLARGPFFWGGGGGVHWQRPLASPPLARAQAAQHKTCHPGHLPPNLLGRGTQPGQRRAAAAVWAGRVPHRRKGERLAAGEEQKQEQRQQAAPLNSYPAGPDES